MLLIRYVLIGAGIALFGSALAVVAYDVYLATQLRRLLAQGRDAEGATPIRTRPPR